jgi:hypothetical protein
MVNLEVLLHQGPHFERARRRFIDFIAELLADASRSGSIRDDVPSRELAIYACTRSGR